MRLLRNLGGGGRSGSKLLVISVLLGICSVFVSGLPQWVWNPEAETGPKNSIGSGNRLIFGGQIASDEKDKVQIKLDDAQARLFLPSIVNAITGGGRPGNRPRPTTNRPSSSSSSGGGGSDSFPPPSTDNNGGGGGGGGSGSSSGQGEGNAEGGGGGDGGQCNTGACIGGSIASQAIEQGINAGTSVAENNKFDPIRQTTNFRPPVGGISGIFSNILQNLFGGSASTLPANIGGIGSGGSSGGSGGGTQCTCEDRSRGCFLPQREVGSCESGTRIRCCTSSRGSRTVFPDEDVSFSSTNSVKSVTRSQIRRALLKNIVRGSGSVIDDTLDLLLHPFLTKEDQVKVATRIISDN